MNFERPHDSGPEINVYLQRRYNSIASRWNSEAYEGTRRDDLIPMLISAAEISDNHRMLDAMCGTGHLGNVLRKQYPTADVHLLDFSDEMLKQAPEGLRKIQSTVTRIPIQSDAYDRVFLRSGLYDLPKDQQPLALEEIQRVLKSKGIFLLQTYVTTDETHETLNCIVNKKDDAAGFPTDTQRFLRYFAPSHELEYWFEEVGFEFDRLSEFEGRIRYMQTGEMSQIGLSSWIAYMQALDSKLKQQIHLHEEEGKMLVFNFPGIIYKLRKY